MLYSFLSIYKIELLDRLIEAITMHMWLRERSRKGNEPQINLIPTITLRNGFFCNGRRSIRTENRWTRNEPFPSPYRRWNNTIGIIMHAFISSVPGTSNPESWSMRMDPLSQQRDKAVGSLLMRQGTDVT